MSNAHRTAEASAENLRRIFTVPEAPDSTLARLEAEISRNLHGFLNERIVATQRSLADIETDFRDARIPEQPMFVSEQADFLLEKVVAESVRTASPAFVGHMTSALPYFMLPLAQIMIALNQNVVKTETSKAFTPLERQVLGMLHHLVYAREESFFYAEFLQDSRHARRLLLRRHYRQSHRAVGGTQQCLSRRRRLRGRGSRGHAPRAASSRLRRRRDTGVAPGPLLAKQAADVLGIGRNWCTRSRSMPATASICARSRRAAASCAQAA